MEHGKGCRERKNTLCFNKLDGNTKSVKFPSVDFAPVSLERIVVSTKIRVQ